MQQFRIVKESIQILQVTHQLFDDFKRPQSQANLQHHHYDSSSEL